MLSQNEAPEGRLGKLERGAHKKSWVIEIANITRHNAIRQGPGGQLEAAHLIIPRYVGSPPDAKDGEIWYDTVDNKLKVNMEGTIKYVTFS